MDDVRDRFAALLSGKFEVSRHESRWLALGDDVVAFAADDDAGWRRLQSEGWLLDRWRSAGVPAPRVLREDARRGVQVRERMHGITGPTIEPRLFGGEPPDAWGRLGNAPLTPFGERLAASYGALASRIRSAVSVADASAAGIGMCRRRALDLDDAIARLHASSASVAAKVAAERARSWLADIPAPDAVIHADLHFWNLCLGDDGSIVGVFDLDDSGIDAAATEYLYVHSLGPRFVATAVAASDDINLEDVQRAHIRAALGHLYWHPHGTERHDSIVGWVSAVLERLVP
jgi:hypothetical protein